MFGRRRPPIEEPRRRASDFTAPRDSDGKRRVFGEAIFAEHGDFLRQMGFGLDDAHNILPEPEDFEARIKESLAQQEARRAALEHSIRQSFGHGMVRPYFIFGDGVLNGSLGGWLIRSMDLLPYDEWNVIYFAMDRPTAQAIEMPLHPEHSIPGLDAIVAARLEPLHDRYRHVVESTVANFTPGEGDWLTPWRDALRQAIVDYAATLRPMIITLVAESQAAID